MSGAVTVALVALSGVGALVAGLGALRAAWGGAWIVIAAARRATRAVADLGDGPLEARGVLAADEPVVAAEGERCVAIRATVHSAWTTRGRKGPVHHDATSSATRFAAGARLRDDTGEVAIDLDGAAVAGARRRLELGRDDFLARFPEHAGLVAAAGRHITLDEERLEVGLDARVWAARCEGGRAGAGPYRGGAGAPRTLRGDARRGVVVAPASEPRLALRALPPALAMVGLGLACVAYAGWCARAIVVGWV